jgi:hypothetical protein
MTEPNDEQREFAAQLLKIGERDKVSLDLVLEVRRVAELLAHRDAAQFDALIEQSESWRRGCVAWQEWAAKLVEQPEGGQLGDGPAREWIAERLDALTAERDELRQDLSDARNGWERAAAALQCERIKDDLLASPDAAALRAELARCNDRLESLRRILDERGLHADERLRRLRAELEKA